MTSLRCSQWAILVALLLIFDLCRALLECPEVCLCSVSAVGTVTVTCSHLGLTTIPDNLPQNISILNLSHNHLTSIAAFPNQPELRILDLSHNRIKLTMNVAIKPSILDNATTDLLQANMSNVFLQDLFQLVQLEHLDLRDNEIGNLPANMFDDLSNLTELYLGSNFIKSLEPYSFQNLSRLITLDLSNNTIRQIHPLSLIGLTSLLRLDVSHNNFTKLTKKNFGQLSQLRWFSMARNPIYEIPNAILKDSDKLEWLYINDMPNLHKVVDQAFSGLENVRHFNFSHNAHLSYIQRELFLDLVHLERLDISFNNISILHPRTFQENRFLQWLSLRGNSLLCTCSIKMLLDNSEHNNSIIKAAILTSGDQLHCRIPGSDKQVSVHDVNVQDLACTNVTITNHTEYAFHQVGSSALLSCDVQGDPSPSIIWTTPRGHIFTHHSYHEDAKHHYWSVNDTFDGGAFHRDHYWHESDSYYGNIDAEERIVVLNDGRLYIDYVLRSDSGPYRCTAENAAGNATVVVEFRLDYTIIKSTQIMTVIVGLAAALAFFILNLIVASIQAAARRCVNQRKRQVIRKLLSNVESYKSIQVGRIKENYNVQVSRIKDQYHLQLDRLRENYTSQIGRIRENCSHQVERLRENYTYQVSRMKDYSSHQILQLRDRYNGQLLKIRDYGSLQMDRLRDNYKLQQKHVLKLIETMNIEHCKGMIDTDCIRTDSMLFDANLLAGPEFQLSPTPDSLSASDYVTATNSEQSSKTGSQITLTLPPAGEFLPEMDGISSSSGETVPVEVLYQVDFHKREDNKSESTSSQNEIQDCAYQDSIVVDFDLVGEDEVHRDGIVLDLNHVSETNYQLESMV